MVSRKTHCMKYAFVLAAISLMAIQCKKDDGYTRQAVTVIIAEKSVHNNTTYAAIVETPAASYSFICSNVSDLGFLPTYSCKNAVYITNLPASLAVPGKKIRFSQWKDSGQPKLLSSINHAHELEIKGAQEVD